MFGSEVANSDVVWRSKTKDWQRGGLKAAGVGNLFYLFIYFLETRMGFGKTVSEL